MGYDYLDKPFPDWIKGSIEERFAAIYRRRFWGEAESVSGPGSSLRQARKLMEALPALFETLEVKSVLDIPCGDFFWMSKTDHGLERYIGADIVAELIDENRARYGGQGREFTCLDMTSDPLPRVDLILCRDGLVHLSFADIRRSFERFLAGGSRFLLMTTFPGHDENRDIESGDWRPLNFGRPPLELPAPELLLNEECPEEGYVDKSLGLWRLERAFFARALEGPGSV